MFVRISVRFCADSHAPSLPLRTPLLSLKFTLLNHNFKVQCNSNYLFFTNMLWYQSCFPAQFEQSLQICCIKAVFGLAWHSFFFAKRELITEADKESCATYSLWLLKKIQLEIIISFNKCHEQPFASFLGNLIKQRNCTWKQVLAVLADLINTQSRLESNANPGKPFALGLYNCHEFLQQRPVFISKKLNACK